MADIWDQVARGIDVEVDAALWKLRESAEFKAMGSEIERALAASFLVSMRIAQFDVWTTLPSEAVQSSGCFLVPQHRIGNYTVDFLFGLLKFPSLRQSIVIECDGHDFHEKTKDQAARDKARDRYLSTQVARTMHFTGREIYRDASACWTEVSRTLAAIHGWEVGQWDVGQ